MNNNSKNNSCQYLFLINEFSYLINEIIEISYDFNFTYFDIKIDESIKYWEDRLINDFRNYNLDGFYKIRNNELYDFFFMKDELDNSKSELLLNATLKSASSNDLIININIPDEIIELKVNNKEICCFIKNKVKPYEKNSLKNKFEFLKDILNVDDKSKFILNLEKKYK